MRYEALADLPLSIESVQRRLRERATTSGFDRVTTTVALAGGGETGRGEDVTYEADHHREFLGTPLEVAGEYTLESFSRHLEGRDLFPTPPDREIFRNYRRWALESAALDLALRQAETDLASALGRPYDPVRFVVSTKLGDPPSTDRLAALGDLAFKLDPEPSWTPGLIDDLAGYPVRILDLKGQYGDAGEDVGLEPDPELYRRVLEGFPDAVIEDPALTDGTRPVVRERKGRVSWDAPITGVEAIRALPFEPRWLNVKPSRFGTVESLFEALACCEERGIALYGGGQFELGVGRGQIQALASLRYPDAPNDVAPAGYNEPGGGTDLPASPLAPPERPRGFRWG